MLLKKCKQTICRDRTTNFSSKTILTYCSFMKSNLLYSVFRQPASTTSRPITITTPPSITTTTTSTTTTSSATTTKRTTTIATNDIFTTEAINEPQEIIIPVIITEEEDRVPKAQALDHPANMFDRSKLGPNLAEELAELLSGIPTGEPGIPSVEELRARQEADNQATLHHLQTTGSQQPATPAEETLGLPQQRETLIQFAGGNPQSQFNGNAQTLVSRPPPPSQSAFVRNPSSQLFFPGQQQQVFFAGQTLTDNPSGSSVQSNLPPTLNGGSTFTQFFNPGVQPVVGSGVQPPQRQPEVPRTVQSQLFSSQVNRLNIVQNQLFTPEPTQPPFFTVQPIKPVQFAQPVQVQSKQVQAIPTTKPPIVQPVQSVQVTRQREKPVRQRVQSNRQRVQPDRQRVQPSRQRVQPVRQRVQGQRQRVQPQRTTVKPAQPTIQPQRQRGQPVRQRVQSQRQRVQPTTERQPQSEVPTTARSAPLRVQPSTVPVPGNSVKYDELIDFGEQIN